jgi:hypothetical protein
VEVSQYYQSGPAQIITERMETLARAIISINHMPLTLTNKEQQDYFDKFGKNPSPLDMARIIFTEKIKSIVILDALYESYVEFADGITEKLEEAKKKLNN